MGTLVVTLEFVAAVAWYFILMRIVARYDRRRFDRTLVDAEALARRVNGAGARSPRAGRELAFVLGQVNADYGLLRRVDRRRYDGRVAQLQLVAASNGIHWPPAVPVRTRRSA